MNRMGDFFSIMMMTSIKHDDAVEGQEAIVDLRSALKDSLSTGPEDDLCARPLPLRPFSSPPVMLNLSVPVAQIRGGRTHQAVDAPERHRDGHYQRHGQRRSRYREGNHLSGRRAEH